MPVFQNFYETWNIFFTHGNVMKAESDLERTEKSGDIKQSFSKVISVQEQDLVGAFKCLYWLCKERIAYTTKYESLLQLAKSLGCGYLDTFMKQKMQNIHQKPFFRKFLLH